MITVVHDYKDKIREWVSNELKLGKIGGDAYHAIGLIEDDKIIGGIIYHGYRGFQIECSLATTTEKWCNRRVLNEFFKYPFITCGVERFQAICKRSNKPMKKFFRKIGFKFEGVARKGFDGREDAFLFSMMKDECKWIRKDNG